MIRRTIRKTFSLLLVFSMLLSMFSSTMSVFATETLETTNDGVNVSEQEFIKGEEVADSLQGVENPGDKASVILQDTHVGETDAIEQVVPDEGFGDEDEPVVTETGVTSADELEAAFTEGYDRIQLLADITLDRTFFVEKNTVIYATEDVTLTRDASFGGDMFLLGPVEKNEEETVEPVVITFGSDDAEITIDGNKDSMTVDVTGTVFFVRNLATVNLNNITVQNAKKVGNEITLDEAYGLPYVGRIGGAAVILASGQLNIYSSTFADNEVNDETSSEEEGMISTQGGAIYSFGALNIYSATFTDNHAARAGAIYNYRETHIYNALFKDNTASYRGGAIYVPAATAAALYTGEEDGEVVFEGNTALDGGGAILVQGTNVYNNTTFTANEATESYGGALYVAGQLTDAKTLEMYNVTFTDNQSYSSGGAIYSTSKAVMLIDDASFSGNKTLAGHGGAIASFGTADKEDRTLELYNATFSENQSYYNGGAVYFSGNAISYMEDVTFSRNQALATANSSGSRYGGGAIYGTGSTIEINGGEFTENTSDYMGGAFEIHSSSVATLNNITATGNTAVNSSGGAFEIQSSSAIAMNKVTATGNASLNSGGGFMHVKNAEAKVYNSVIENNSGNTGGAIAFYEGAKGGVYNTEFNANKSQTQGGALFIYTDGEKVTLHTIKFNNNVADNFGGAIYISNVSLADMYNITARGNGALSGGFMYETKTGTVVTLNGLTISGNTATNGPIIFGNSTGAKLNINKTNYVDEDATTELDDAYWAEAIVNKLTVSTLISLVPGYKDFGEEGGEDDDAPAEVIIGVMNAAELEAALNQGYDKIQILRGFKVDRTFEVTKNTAIFAKENVTLTRDASFGGDMFLLGSAEKSEDEAAEHVAITFGSEEAKITIDGNKDNMTVDVVGTVFFVRNLAEAELRGVNVINAKKVGNERVLEEAYTGLSYASQIGGAAVILTSGKLDIYNSEFTNNEVSVFEKDNTDSISGRGAAIYSFGALNVYNSAFTNNQATKAGAIYAYRETHLTDTSFEGNTASTLGGAIYIPSSTVAFVYTDNATFKGNSATSGGAIYAAATVGFIDTSFTENEATTSNGGAVYLAGKKTSAKSLDAENVTFTDNIAAKAGGAIYIATAETTDADGNTIKIGAETLFNGATFTGNKANGGHGGALWAAGGDETDIKTIELYNATFTENQTSSRGGAIYLSKAVSYMEDVVFTENRALADNGTAYGGGAIYSTGSTFEINGAKFIKNVSDYIGGAIELRAGSAVILNDITAEENTSVANGGFMYANNSSLKIYNSYIKGNVAGTQGGAIDMQASASGEIHKTDFIANKATSGNGGALVIYTNGKNVTLNEVLFENNSSANFGGAMYVSNKSLLDMYNIEAVGNSAANGGFMYETTNGTVVNLNGLTVSGNTATTGGPIIWGNTTNAVLNINKTNYVDKDEAGEFNDAYWAKAIVNKLTVNDLSGEIPKPEDYGNETTDGMDDIVDVRTIDELEAALAGDAKNIKVTSNIVVDRTLYVIGEKVLFTTTKKTIKRSPDFKGDMFLVGEDKDGNYPLIEGIETVFTLGNPESKTENLLIIDGNRDNMSGDVVGSAIFVAGGATLNIYNNVSIINNYKNGNDRGFAEKYALGSPEKVGGAAIINIDGTVYMYGGLVKDNMSDGAETGINGGAIHNRSNFTIYDGTFQNNEGTLGAVIYNLKRLDVMGGKFIENHSLRNGGAIYIASSQYAHLYIGKTEDAGMSDKVLFKNNTSDSSGAAIYNSVMGAVIINGGVTFESNVANVSGGAIATYGTLNVSNAAFISNSAKTRGGAIYLSNSNDVYTTRIVNVKNSLFKGNESTVGGAVAVYASNTTLSEGGIVEIENCDFIENKAINLTDNPEADDVFGGAIFNSRKGSVTVADSNFSKNTAQYEGGVIYSAGESKTIVTGSTFTNNSVTAEKARGGVLSIHSASIEFDGATFTGNSAPSNGGALYVSYTTASTVNSSVKVTDSVFNDNTAGGNGAAIYATEHEVEEDELALTVKNTKFNNNEAKANGGAVYLTAKVDANMKDVDFTGNKAVSETSKNYGGAIYLASGSSLEIDGATFTKNEASYCGGGIALHSSSKITLNNIEADGNISGGSAGFLYGNNAKIIIFDSIIKNSSSGINGGAMALYNVTTVAAYGVTFEGNMSQATGGAIYSYQNLTEVLLHSCIFKDNEAKANGGAIYLSNEGILNMYNTEAVGNKADKGGFFYETTTGSEATIRNLIVEGNSATTDGDIIFGNSYGATLYIDKINYEDRLSDVAGDDAYWDDAIKNMLTVVDISGTEEEIPERLYYEAEEDSEEEEEERKLVPVAEVLSLGLNSSDAAINSTYGKLEKLDNSSNFMSDNVTVFEDINGEDVMVDTFVYHPNHKEGNGNFGLGMLIYQAILYKDAHPEEDVKISIAEFRFEMETAICINRNSRYFGYMRNLVGADQDKYGFVRISYLLVTAAKMGIDVTVMGQIPGYPHNASDPDFIEYFEDHLKDPCDPVYVGEGKKVGDYMKFVPCEWTSYEDKAGSDMMHLKMVTASHYLDMNGVEHKNAVFSSSANLDGINSSGTNGNNKMQTATIVTNHEALYRTTTNYINLIAENRGQEEVYLFRNILAERTAQQFDLILAGRENEIPADQQIVYLGTADDDVFELYFTPFGGEPNAWTEKYNPYCKYIKKLANSEDYIILTWNNANYISSGLVEKLEDMIIDAYHDNKNPNNKIYVNLAEFDASAFSDLEVGEDIGLKSFNQKEFGALHTKDLQVSYVENGERSYVTLFNSLNMHSGAIGYQANFVLVIKEDSPAEGSVFFALAENTTNGVVEHTYGEEKTYIPETNEDGYVYKECEYCDKTIVLETIHRQSDWIVVKEATALENGIAYKKCTSCDKLLSAKEIVGNDVEVVVIDYSKSDVGLNLSSADDACIIDETFASSPKTFEASFLLPKSVSQRAGVLIGNYDNTKAEQINVEIYTNGKPRLYYKTKNKSYTYLFSADVRSDSNTHLAITIDGLTATLYLNGVAKETVTLDAEIANAYSGYKIGADNRESNSPYFKGTIYSVTMFNDVRTAEEIGRDMILVPSDSDGILFSKYFADSSKGLDNIFTNNISYDGTVWSCDLSLFLNETVCGNVYLAVYEGDQFKKVVSYVAAAQIPVSVECEEGQTVKIFWWNSNLKPLSRTVEIEVK